MGKGSKTGGCGIMTETLAFYGPNDMVRADCGDCRGCSHCCHDMGDSITLDPYDIFRLTKATGKAFPEMIGFEIQLGMKGYVILPHLRMKEQGNCCSFLDENGRCRIHTLRPGICRLFPLGRVYEDGQMKYFLQSEECLNKNRTKIKVKKWISAEEGPRYQAFELSWHRYLERKSEELSGLSGAELKERNMEMLNRFYMTAYGDDFFSDFDTRLSELP